MRISRPTRPGPFAHFTDTALIEALREQQAFKQPAVLELVTRFETLAAVANADPYLDEWAATPLMPAHAPYSPLGVAEFVRSRAEAVDELAGLPSGELAELLAVQR